MLMLTNMEVVMTIIKDMFVSFFTTLGIISSTAKDSFMEGWKNPYVPVTEEDVEDARAFSNDIRKEMQDDMPFEDKVKQEWSISSQ